MIVTSYKCDYCHQPVEEGLIIKGPIDLILKSYEAKPLFGADCHICLDCLSEIIDQETNPELESTTPSSKKLLPPT